MFIDADAVLDLVTSSNDPVERIKNVGAALVEIQNLTAELGRLRREEVEELKAAGMSQNAIARAIGLTSARMSQVMNNAPAPERAFFGVKIEPIIAAVAEKREADKPKPGPVISIDDMQAYDGLRNLVADLGLTSTYEVVRPPGNIWLNRNGLVVICGPRHSSLIEQVLGSDDKLSFEKDDAGWHLVDHVEGVAYRSPEDSDEPGDIAYLGRLPRPDGKGYFLYLAGIHAAGAAGVVHYLGNELASLYREVRNRRFSTLIQCRYDPETHTIISSERITPVYKHEG
ncbi:helix-turn-helix domain-containing protein [Nonomuraea basaltis]|uniref:helix-turn-helix domain-containing protein n=1 Tax=Nonomuraea basaltis TaxID=2495887 RepID=UPI00110C5599|nr:helix-turn-helix domain-containing protein [Nonomuraea basaltis]TMS00218.1 sigma-70 family RNA polymerase sigma factor [Nonomuraea basaltis]